MLLGAITAIRKEDPRIETANLDISAVGGSAIAGDGLGRLRLIIRRNECQRHIDGVNQLELRAADGSEHRERSAGVIARKDIAARHRRER